MGSKRLWKVSFFTIESRHVIAYCIADIIKATVDRKIPGGIKAIEYVCDVDDIEDIIE